MKLRALENPVRSARIVKHEKSTLTLEVETERGRYRWDVRPIYHFEIGRLKLEFEYDWRAALKSLIRQSIGIYPTKLNPSGIKWRYVGGEHRASKNWLLLRVKYKRLDRRYEWTVYSPGGEREIAAGTSSSLPAAKAVVETIAERVARRQPRTLFNPRRSRWLKSGHKIEYRKGEWVGQVWEVNPFRVDYRIARFWDNKWRVFGTRTSVVAAKKAVEVFIRHPKMPDKPRMLFNPTQEMLRHGKIVIERVKIPRAEAQRLRRVYGWSWKVYITMGLMLKKPGDERLYGPVASGLALRRSKAVEDSKKAYSRLVKTQPRTLFNPHYDEIMQKKGYRYKLTPKSGYFEPLYAKDISHIAYLLRMYPKETFNILDLVTKKLLRSGPRTLFNAVRR